MLRIANCARNTTARVRSGARTLCCGFRLTGRLLRQPSTGPAERPAPPHHPPHKGRGEHGFCRGICFPFAPTRWGRAGLARTNSTQPRGLKASCGRCLGCHRSQSVTSQLRPPASEPRSVEVQTRSFPHSACHSAVRASGERSPKSSTCAGPCARLLRVRPASSLPTAGRGVVPKRGALPARPLQRQRTVAGRTSAQGTAPPPPPPGRQRAGSPPRSPSAPGPRKGAAEAVAGGEIRRYRGRGALPRRGSLSPRARPTPALPPASREGGAGPQRRRRRHHRTPAPRLASGGGGAAEHRGPPPPPGRRHRRLPAPAGADTGRQRAACPGRRRGAGPRRGARRDSP